MVMLYSPENVPVKQFINKKGFSLIEIVAFNSFRSDDIRSEA